MNPAEKELLRWHYRLGHLAFAKVQALLRSGVLSHSSSSRSLHAAASKLTNPPKCCACLFGKQRARPTGATRTTIVSNRAGITRQGNLHPGQEVSVDHFVCSTKGRLFTSKGKSRDEDMYCGGALFIDHASGFIHTVPQTSLSSHFTLMAKRDFEQIARDNGVVPLRYLTDNSTSFTSTEFQKHLSLYRQVNRFAGVGAHHHAGYVERAIQTVISIARTMLLHAAIHWPQVADPSLWPMAVNHATWLWNRVPTVQTGLSATDLFSRTRSDQKEFLHCHVWGCPVYVLDKSLSDGKKIPKWKPRGTRCIYMGRSPNHAGSVPLVLNPHTGTITPQFHCVFDDWFATIATSVEDLPDFNSDEWYKLFGQTNLQYVTDGVPQDEDDSPGLSSDSADFDAVARRRSQVESRFRQSEPSSPLAPPPATIPISSPLLPSAETGNLPSGRNASSPAAFARDGAGLPPSAPSPDTMPAPQPTSPSVVPATDHEVEKAIIHPTEEERHEISSPKHDNDDVPPPLVARRSSRVRSAPNRLTYNERGTPAAHYTSVFMGLDWVGPALIQVAMNSGPSHDPDTLSFDAAMAEDEASWMAAAKIEVRALEAHGAWDEVPIEDATSRILPGTWVFRRKRTPDGTIKKLKGRYCVRGDLQENVEETYAPVATFCTVRTFLVVAIQLNWHTCSVDFSSAFIQASLTKPIWVHIPRGFRSSRSGRTCLCLKKSCYGIAEAPRLWHEHLFKALLSLGFKRNSIDPCLLMREDCFIICYVDDCGIAVKAKKVVVDLVESLRNKGFDLTMEGSFSEFLGIKFEEVATGKIHMSQRGLIKKIFTATGMENCPPNWTPAARRVLDSDENGDAIAETWNYSSIVGMLLYLSGNTRPDISFAVSQVARYCHTPKQSHAVAVKMIVRYLKRTETQGLIVDLSQFSMELTCYVDADFAGRFGADAPSNPASARSRTGFVIKLGGCPLIWKSQLQKLTALSTAESEYIALSHAMRILIPIQSLLQDLFAIIDVPYASVTTQIRATVFEDNSTALQLATRQVVTTRTRHIAVRFHHFWENVSSKQILCEKIPSAKQQGDFLTKPLCRELFEKCRKMVKGW